MSDSREYCDDTAAEAFRWVLQFSGNQPLSAQTLTEFREWLRRSPEHARRFQLAATFFTCLKRLRPIADHDKATWTARAARICRVLVDHEAPVSMAETLWRPTELSFEKTAHRRSRFARAMSAAGAVGAAAAVAVLAIGAIFLFEADTSWNHDTADGSNRQFQLREGGVALEVAHDPARPFHVDATEASMLASPSELSGSGLSSPAAIRVDSGTMQVSTACQLMTLQAGMTAQIDSEGGIEVAKKRDCQAPSQLDLHELRNSLHQARATAKDYASSLQRIRAERDEAVDVMRTVTLQLANSQSALRETRQQLLDSASSPRAPSQNEPQRMAGIDPSVSGFKFDKCANLYDRNEIEAWPITASMWDSVTMQFVSSYEWVMLQSMRWSEWVRVECEKLDRGNALQPSSALA